MRTGCAWCGRQLRDEGGDDAHPLSRGTCAACARAVPAWRARPLAAVLEALPAPAFDGALEPAAANATG